MESSERIENNKNLIKKHPGDENKIEGNVKKKGKYPCEFCNLSFTRKDRLESHLFLHTGIKNFECEFCSKTYLNSSHLKRHMKSHTKSPNPNKFYICVHPDCSQEFTNMRVMDVHYNEVHRPTTFPYKCDECEASHRRKIQHKRHLKIVHNIGSYTFECDKCERGFFNKYAFTKHFANHQKIQQCKDCQKTFNNWSQLVAHRRENHKVKKIINCQCDVCGKTFYTKNNIRQHIKTHIMEKSETIYVCTYEGCSKFYHASRNLKAHISSKHECKKVFQCPICKVKLASKQKLQLHVDAHNDPVKSKFIKKPNIEIVLGIKIHQNNTRQELLNQVLVKRINDGISTESEFSDNNN